MRFLVITSLLEYLKERKALRPMMEMANFYPQNTGLDRVLWMGEVGGQHGPRIKVCNTLGKMQEDNCFVVAVTKEPWVTTPRTMKISKSELDDVLDWIKLNYDVLMELWKINESGDGDAHAPILRLRKL